MPEVAIEIGGRVFEVACNEGEEHFLQSAAAMLDTEAATIISQIGRLPEPRMLLMAGLMLADKTAGATDELEKAKANVAALEAELAELKAAPQPEPTRVEVPVIPQAIKDTMAELAARAEALAEQIEEKSAS